MIAVANLVSPAIISSFLIQPISALSLFPLPQSHLFPLFPSLPFVVTVVSADQRGSRRNKHRAAKLDDSTIYIIKWGDPGTAGKPTSEASRYHPSSFTATLGTLL